MVVNAFIDQFVSLGETFFDVATADPLSGVLVGIGGLLTAVSIAIFGYLSLRGAVSGGVRLSGN